MTTVDWVALGLVALTALLGLRTGLLASALSLAGVVGGAVLGARLAPQLLTNGSSSPYTPLVALAGAVLLAALLRAVGSMVGAILRGGLTFSPLRAVDSAGGALLGAASGLFVVWVLGAVALQLPGQRELRTQAQRSQILQRLNQIVPPERLLNALARVDPLPRIAGPSAPVAPPDPSILRNPTLRRAAPSVVRVLGTACGLGVVGSGWVVERRLVVTAAHVVAGQDDTWVQTPRSRTRLRATAVAFDPRNDVAILRVPGVRARPLLLAGPRRGDPVAIVGYPENGPLSATPGRIGRTATVRADDAYGRGPVTRTITSLRGLVRHGNSGGPAIDAGGRVELTIFAAGRGSLDGYGIPAEVVRRALAQARGPVSTGACVP